MPRFVAFLRGVSPLNLQMADLRASLERAGFAQVRTVLASGNAVFDADAAYPARLEQAVEAALQQALGKSFPAIVRSVGQLQALLATDPYAGYGLPADAKRVVSFLRAPRAARLPLPLTEGTATVIHQQGSEVFTAYRPDASGPVFMKLIEQAYGKDVTSRTWDTLRKCAAA